MLTQYTKPSKGSENICVKKSKYTPFSKVQSILLTLTMLWANSADDKPMIFFLISLENVIWHFMQIVSLKDNLHEVSNPFVKEK